MNSTTRAKKRSSATKSSKKTTSNLPFVVARLKPAIQRKTKMAHRDGVDGPLSYGIEVPKRGCLEAPQDKEPSNDRLQADGGFGYRQERFSGSRGRSPDR